MIIEQHIYSAPMGWNKTVHAESTNFKPQLVIAFGSRANFSKPNLISELKQLYPEAKLIGCSTSGEIQGESVLDDSIVVSALEFEKTKIEFSESIVSGPEGTFDAAKNLVSKLPQDNLKHVFVLSDGLNVNGTQLVNGLRELLADSVHVTGGLAGDGASFEQTLVLSDENVDSNKIIGTGFYGDNLKIGFGSFGGWDSFGVERMVTKSKNNVLYEIDNEPALKLYKSFLGDRAAELPASGLLFPLSLRSEADSLAVVRTILAINEEDQSITFAGDLPEGAYVKLMKANVDRLISGADKAANNSLLNPETANPDFAILISCVGRKLVLKQLVEEEVEATAHVLGSKTIQTGFYSYGEISPFSSESKCELHNQTMTITTFKEV